MKRVLNSGSIKLPYIQGSESKIIADFKGVTANFDLNDPMETLLELEIDHCGLPQMQFKFEIKAPQLVFQAFQNSNLGSTKLLGTDHQVAYLPPSFYKSNRSGFNPMSPRETNELNTKLNNFFNWSFNFYNKLVENGLCSEQAELVLPAGVFKTFIWDVNAKDLILFIEQNCHKSPEMFGYTSTLVLYLEEHLPQVTRYLKANKWKDLI
jgi:hypothetical protein